MLGFISLTVLVIMAIFFIAVGCKSTPEQRKKMMLENSDGYKIFKLNYGKTKFPEKSYDNQPGTYLLFPVKGISYREKWQQNRAWGLLPYEPITLQLDFNNPKDENAIRVISADNIFLGYMNRDYAKFVRPHFSSLVDCYVRFVLPDGDLPSVICAAYFSDKFYIRKDV